MVRKISIAEAKLERRQEAKKIIPGSSTSARESKRYRENVEKEARKLVMGWNADGRPEAAINADLITYYTNNYYPENQMTIVALIEKSRTIPGSGRTPELIAELRRAQKKWDSQAYPY